MEKIHSRNNTIFALLVFAISFVVFFLTAQPTVAFWDCGEYVSAGESMGVPHPPGNPLLMILFRVSSIILSPFVADVGFRMNLFVVFCSALTAVVIYLTAVRAGIAIVGMPDTTWKRIAIYTGGFVGGLFAVFGKTFWFSAVEQSEANVAMLFVAFATWLSVVWSQSKDPNRDKYLILMAFSSFLGIAIHMYSMIVLPPMFFYVLLVDKEKRYDWRIWLTVILLGLVIKDLTLFIFTGPIAIFITLVATFIDTKNRKKWSFCLALSTVAVLGFSAHLYLPIRASLNPNINENAPYTWPAFKQYLERKQYGDESMFKRMFWRRGTWGHQFGIEERMGYGGFHLTQFFQLNEDDSKVNFIETNPGSGFIKLLIYLIPTFFMFYGLLYLYKRDRKLAVFLTVLFLITSVVLVFYMNFADGLRPERAEYEYWVKAGKPGPMPTVHREVRVRDYFYAAAFMYYGMLIGLAAIALLHSLFSNKDKSVRMTIAPIMSILLMASPALPLVHNWKDISRKGDWVAYDYAYNLLNSCEKDGILFTNGDNDTFPLWALQEAYGVRTDVRIVNLSLVNTPWYILQMKNFEPKVPISFTDKQIEKMEAQLNPFDKPTPFFLKGAGIQVVLPSVQQMRVLKVQDQMVLNIVDANRWKKPIYFVTSVGDDVLMGLGPYLKLEGLVYRVMPQPVPEEEKIDIQRSAELMTKVYRYTNLENGKANLNETSSSLLTNYEASYIQIALGLRQPIAIAKTEIAMLQAKGDLSDSIKTIISEKQAKIKENVNLAIDMLERCKRLVPADWRPRILMHEILVENGMINEAEAEMRKALEIDPDNAEYKNRLAELQNLKTKDQQKSTPLPEAENK